MDLAAALGLELGMLSGDEDDVDDVSHPPALASPISAERRSQLRTGMASCINALCAMQGAEEVEEQEEADTCGSTLDLGPISAATVAAQPPAPRRGRRSNAAMRILAEAAVKAEDAAALLGQQQPVKRSRSEICAAARAQKKAKLPLLLTDTAVLKGQAQQCFSNAQQKALRNILYSTSSGGSSATMMANLLGVSRLWLPHVRLACAEEIIAQDESAFHDMLLKLRDLHTARLVEPMQFTLFRMYDETPEKFRTVTASGSSVEADSCTAKVLACQREWCMLLACRRSASQLTAPGESTALPDGFGLHDTSDDSVSEYTAVWGVLTTSLVPIQNQTAEVLLTATLRKAWLPPGCQALVEDIFPRRILVSTTDMHGSNVKAERATAAKLAGDRPRLPANHHGWHCLQVRCEMHRSHTCELKTHDLVSATVSGVLNVGLSFRIPGVAGRVRKSMRLYIREPGRLVIMHGTPSHEAVAWKTAIINLFSRQPTRHSKSRAAVISGLCNGDWRIADRLEHYCPPGCCPRGLSQTLDKFCNHLVPALTGRLPMIFPRRIRLRVVAGLPQLVAECV